MRRPYFIFRMFQRKRALSDSTRTGGEMVARAGSEGEARQAEEKVKPVWGGKWSLWRCSDASEGGGLVARVNRGSAFDSRPQSESVPGSDENVVSAVSALEV